MFGFGGASHRFDSTSRRCDWLAGMVASMGGVANTPELPLARAAPAEGGCNNRLAESGSSSR